LIAEVADLQNQYADHFSLKLFLEIIESVGHHLAEYPDVACSSSCGLLNSVFERLNHALFTMKPKQGILVAHIESMSDYRQWHELIVAEVREAVVVTPETESGKVVEPTADSGEISEQLMTAIQDVVRREVDAMREELLEVMRENM
jgi:hypothetical protein